MIFVIQNPKKLKQEGRAHSALIFRNLHDNTIRYSDMILSKLLTMLQASKDAKNSSWLYLSDHGQDVCHNTNFSGHNHQAKQQWEIPMVFWSADKKYYKDKKKIINKKYSADLLDNTILGLLGIKGPYYHKQCDIFGQ